MAVYKPMYWSPEVKSWLQMDASSSTNFMLKHGMFYPPPVIVGLILIVPAYHIICEGYMCRVCSGTMVWGWHYCRRPSTNIWPLWEVKLIRCMWKLGIFALLFGSNNSYYHGALRRKLSYANYNYLVFLGLYEGISI